MVIVVLAIAALVMLSNSKADAVPQEIKVSDADTVWIDGVKYRIHGLDTPEQKGNAKCDQERELARAANAFAHEVADHAELVVTKTYGEDFFGRTVSDIAINGKDWAELMISTGHGVDWDYDGGELKPDWCDAR